jgi:hypothetical protein
MPVVMTDNDSPMHRVFHGLEDVCTQPLRQTNADKNVRRSRNFLTCEVWITVRSFIRENPASILPRRPMLTISDYAGSQDKDGSDLLSRTRFSSFERDLTTR